MKPHSNSAARIPTPPVRLRGYGDFPYLGRPMAGAAVAVPEVIELGQGKLRYASEAKVQGIETEGLLDAFLTLAIKPQADDDDVFRFAKTYGPLWLCSYHACVACHRPVPLMDSALRTPAKGELVSFDLSSLYCVPAIEREQPRIYSECIADWRRLAREAHDLLEIAANLREFAKRSRSNPIDAALDTVAYCDKVAEKWRALDGVDLNDPAYKQRSHWAYLADPWQRISEDLNYWLLCSDVRVFVTAVDRGDFQLRLGSNRFFWSVLSPIALEIVMAVCHAGGLGICSGCGHPYLLRRQPLRETRNFCDRCRKAGVPNRFSARDSRERKRGKGQ